MKRFILDGKYKDILTMYHVPINEVLAKAQLSQDTLNHSTITMAESEYYDFIRALGELAPTSTFAVDFATMEHIESFSPPIFAAYCSKNGHTCLERLSAYKQLIGPMTMHVCDDYDGESISYGVTQQGLVLPTFLVELEFAFLINLLRKATKKHIVPCRVVMTAPPTSDTLTAFLGQTIEIGDVNQITVSHDDLELPFISYNEAMWSYFGPEMNRRLAELDVDDTMSARLRSALTELLPSGATTIDDAADALGLSKRTLQRKLRDEGTTFQKQLNHTREILALHYIQHTDMTLNDIAYLLGYVELNSFLRAFTVWTGMSVREYRQKNIL